MALPVIPVTQFQIKSKYLPKTLTMRPFLCGEEAILLQVKDSEDKEEVLGAIKQVLKECVIEPADFQPGEIPFFMIEYAFIKLTQHSKGEMVDLVYRCNHKTQAEEGDKTCGHKMEFQIDLRNAEVAAEEDHTNMFDVGGGLGVELQYPNLDMVDMSQRPDDFVEALALSIKTIYNKDTVWLASDHTKEELMNFAKGVTTKTKHEMMEKFFNRMPRVRSEAKVTCAGCGHTHEITLTGIEDHFA